tara:strand:+ start:194 stop:520 length:327 start_codon:yes stop_codon:yes gene_type:complete
MKTFLTLFVFFFSYSLFAGCISSDCTNGFGTYISANGNKYVGEWKDDKKHGKETFTFTNGDVERGIWENGELVEENIKIVKPKETQSEILEGYILEVIWENLELSEEY